jgi:alpha-galactosidase
MMCFASIALLVDGKTFTLNGNTVSYQFHVDGDTGDLRTDHFGGPITGPIPADPKPLINGVPTELPDRVRRELPDQGRGDFRIPAIRIRQREGYTVSELKYQIHTIVRGKPGLPGLPATFGGEEDVTTIIIHLYDDKSQVAADLTYAIFPKYDAVVRSVSVMNQGTGNITVEVLASLSVDFAVQDLDMITLSGDHMREAHRERRKVERGLHG